MTDYKPGTVAMVQLKGDQCPTKRAWLDADGCWIFADGYSAHSSRPDLIADVRPLVVLDLDDSERAALRNRALRSFDYHQVTVDAIEAQTRPPKPAEPTGLGAVVEDAEGVRWVLYTHPHSTAPWFGEGVSSDWVDIDAVRTIHEGVTA